MSVCGTAGVLESFRAMDSARGPPERLSGSTGQANCSKKRDKSTGPSLCPPVPVNPICHSTWRQDSAQVNSRYSRWAFLKTDQGLCWSRPTANVLSSSLLEGDPPPRPDVRALAVTAVSPQLTKFAGVVLTPSETLKPGYELGTPQMVCMATAPPLLTPLGKLS